MASTAQPTIVSTNDTVQFTTSIFNDDTSNVSQLYFTTSTLPAGATVSKITADRAGCSTTTTPLCTFGALRPQESVRVTIIFTTPSVADASVTSCPLGSTGYQAPPLTTLSGSAPYYCVDLRWYANGFPTTDGGNSHGDFFDWFDGAGLNGDATNFRGRFVYLDNQTLVRDGQTISKSNKQSTSALVPDVNLPATVADESGVTETLTCTTPPGTTFDCGTLTSAWSQIDVANGKDYQSLNTPFSITIQFYQAPSNLKGSSPVGYHTWFDPISNTTNSELIKDACQLKGGVPTATSPIPCLTVTNGGKAVTIWTFHNGGMRF